MADLKGSATSRNLKSAFARASQASSRFAWFAARAEVEGHTDVAEALRSMASDQAAHSHGHLQRLADTDAGDPMTDRPFGTTVDNLKSAIEGELTEYTEMLPEFAAAARKEGLAEVAEWFDALVQVDKGHAARLRECLESLV